MWEMVEIKYCLEKYSQLFLHYSLLWTLFYTLFPPLFSIPNNKLILQVGWISAYIPYVYLCFIHLVLFCCLPIRNHFPCLGGNIAPNENSRSGELVLAFRILYHLLSYQEGGINTFAPFLQMRKVQYLVVTSLAPSPAQDEAQSEGWNPVSRILFSIF